MPPSSFSTYPVLHLQACEHPLYTPFITDKQMDRQFRENAAQWVLYLIFLWIKLSDSDMGLEGRVPRVPDQAR
jgi:hypothetical protein